MRPKLPAADRIGAYLCKIDESRIYSNFGPLARSLEDRLGARFGLSGENVCSLANGTLGLTLALMAQGATLRNIMPHALLDLRGICACRADGRALTVLR